MCYKISKKKAMVNLTKIEQEFLEYEENNKWKDIFLVIFDKIIF